MRKRLIKKRSTKVPVKICGGVYGYESYATTIRARKTLLLRPKMTTKIKALLNKSAATKERVVSRVDSFPGLPRVKQWAHDSSSPNYCGVDYDNNPHYSLIVMPTGKFRFEFRDTISADGDIVESIEERTSWIPVTAIAVNRH